MDILANQRYTRFATYTTGVIALSLAASSCGDAEFVGSSVVRLRSAIDNTPIAGATLSLSDEFGVVTTVATDEEGMSLLGEGEIPFTHFSVRADGYLSSVAVDDELSAVFGVPIDARLTLDLELDPETTDTDADGLSDLDEERLGTDPEDSDTDDDGIPDNVESLITAPFGAPALNASPLHRDLFWEIDWAQDPEDPEAFPEWAPSQEILDIFVRVWENSPLTNPDGTTGIHAVVDAGAYGGGSAIDISSTGACGRTIDVSDAIDPSRRAYFFHGISYETVTGGFGCADLPGRRHYVQGTLGEEYENLLRSALPIVVRGIDVDRLIAEGRAGIYLHELGHNFGLYHGGDVEVHCKPNYPSVMSYNPIMALGGAPAFFDGTFGSDFSDGDEPSIDETAMDEMNPPPMTGQEETDFNENEVIDEDPVESTINVNGFDSFGIYGALLQQAFSPNRCPNDGPFQVLEDANDWVLMDFDQAPLQ